MSKHKRSAFPIVFVAIYSFIMLFLMTMFFIVNGADEEERLEPFLKDDSVIRYVNKDRKEGLFTNNENPSEYFIRLEIDENKKYYIVPLENKWEYDNFENETNIKKGDELEYNVNVGERGVLRTDNMDNVYVESVTLDLIGEERPILDGAFNLSYSHHKDWDK